MRLWRKKENVEEVEPEAGGVAPAGEPAAAVEATPTPEAAPAAAVEATPTPEAAPAGDPNLPGSAGYRHRKKGDAMPGRFTFVRPDGQPEPKEKRNWLFG